MIRTIPMLGAAMLAAPVFAQESAPPSDSAAPAAEIAGAVAADWPRHDQGGKGHLTQAEFSNWLASLRAGAGAAGEDPAKVKAWADASFPKADGDGDARVTPEELTRFLQSKVRK